MSALANPCAYGGASGIGGTGLVDEGDGSGVGGTGIGKSGNRKSGPDGSGIGGTGNRGEGSGIGGTGQRAELGGLGGTGHQGDGSGLGGTSVVGVVTGFGSVCVSGIELHYDASTPVTQDGEPFSSKGLAIGQWVSIEAQGQGDSLKAQRIAVHSALVGPVSWVSPLGDSFIALGQKVHLNKVQLPNSAQAKVELSPGQVVRVSGVRDVQGNLLATRVDKVRPDTPARLGNGVGSAVAAASVQASRMVLQGPVLAKLNNGELNLGYTRVKVSNEVMTRVQVGEWVRVEVRDHHGSKEARSVVRDGLVRERLHHDHDRTERTLQPVRAVEKAEVELREVKIEIEAPERAERAEKLEVPEKVEKVEKVEKPEKIEKPEKVEKPEKYEKPEKPEWHER